MITILNKNEILNRHNRGESIRSIARELGLTKNTVKKYIRKNDELVIKLNNETSITKISLIQQAISSAPTRAKASIKKRVFTEEVEKDFYKIISLSNKKDEILGTNKQKLTATKIHKTLCELGHNISLSTVSNRYREYKKTCKEVFESQE